MGRVRGRAWVAGGAAWSDAVARPAPRVTTGNQERSERVDARFIGGGGLVNRRPGPAKRFERASAGGITFSWLAGSA